MTFRGRPLSCSAVHLFRRPPSHHAAGHAHRAGGHISFPPSTPDGLTGASVAWRCVRWISLSAPPASEPESGPAPADRHTRPKTETCVEPESASKPEPEPKPAPADRTTLGSKAESGLGTAIVCCPSRKTPRLEPAAKTRIASVARHSANYGKFRRRQPAFAHTEKIPLQIPNCSGIFLQGRSFLYLSAGNRLSVAGREYA